MLKWEKMKFSRSTEVLWLLRHGYTSHYLIAFHFFTHFKTRAITFVGCAMFAVDLKCRKIMKLTAVENLLSEKIYMGSCEFFFVRMKMLNFARLVIKFWGSNKSPLKIAYQWLAFSFNFYNHPFTFFRFFMMALLNFLSIMWWIYS